jgi:hypothetical protein
MAFTDRRGHDPMQSVGVSRALQQHEIALAQARSQMLGGLGQGREGVKPPGVRFGLRPQRVLRVGPHETTSSVTVSARRAADRYMREADAA